MTFIYQETRKKKFGFQKISDVSYQVNKI